jgi:serpin B
MDTPTTARSDFAPRLYDKLAGTQAGKNLFLSPFSTQVALAMCAAGAKGETRRVLAELIGAPEGVGEQSRQYADLLKLVNGEGEWPFRLVTANALWVQQGYHFNPAYRKAVAYFYGGAFHGVNFHAQPEEAVRAINAWVSKKTRKKIKELLNRDCIDADTRLVLTNAVYFKGRWVERFDRAATTDEDWHGPGGTGKVPMMHREGGYYHYYQGDGFQALGMPYEGFELAMLVVLPTQKGGLAALETRFAAEGLYQQVVGGLYHEGVVVSLPRFTMEAEFRLKPVLCALGAGLAFSDGADFGGIGEGPLRLSEVVHKAFVEVNEEGTEAAAATGVSVGTGEAMRLPTEPPVFRADHPFLFFIRDRDTNAVLFSGRLLHPE